MAISLRQRVGHLVCQTDVMTLLKIALPYRRFRQRTSSAELRSNARRDHITALRGSFSHPAFDFRGIINNKQHVREEGLLG